MNQCATCGEDFSSVAAFDEHRVGVHAYTFAEGMRFDPPTENGRRCLAVAEMQDEAWTRDEKSRWRYPEDWQMQSHIWDSEEVLV